ncbi:MAG: extracellular solute-binding protein [Rhodobacteraceae bacterium]|jgi:spermidine/putrescine transport system substrate-binding protein|nr:extracellular solute-binding protein [Paracoccaceae bacterium]
MRTLLATTVLSALIATSAQAQEELKLYNWFEYMPAELLDKFTSETGIKVVMDTHDGNEALLAALKAGKLGRYDLAVPSDYMVAILGHEGMLDTFTADEIPNFGNIEPKWLDVPFDPGRHSSVPYQWGTTSFMVNRKLYDGPIDTTDIIFNPPETLKGKINVLDSSGETLALASLHLGIPQCSTDREQLKALNALVLGAKPDWASFGSDVAKDVLVSGDAAAGMIWSGFGAKARAENPDLEYAYPRQGYIVWMDNLVLLKDAPNRKAALAFMNFMLEPENAGALSNYARYAPGVTGAEAFVDADLMAAPETNPPADGNGVFVETCPQDSQVLYDAIWTNLKK